MKIIALLCAAVAADCVHAAGVWDGGSGDGLYFTTANWDNDLVPTFSQVPTFPAAAPNKQIDLGGNGIAHERFVMQGGFRVFNGRVGVAGGGPNSEIESSGNNTLDANYGTFEWGNDIKLIQGAGGTLTLNGSSTDWVKSVILRGAGTIEVNGTISPLNGYAFYKDGSGLVRINPAGRIQGANSGRFVTSGTLLLNGISDAAGTWTVNGGRFGGTGTLHSALSAGSSLGSSLAPGDPASADGVGTLTVNSTVALGDHAVLEIDLGNPGTADRLAITGSLDISGHTGLWLKTAPGSTPSGTYTVVTHSGARSGTFVLLDGPPGARLDYSVAGEVRVVIGTPAAEENIVFPSGAEIVNVTLPPYNAIPDDGLDDTAAIQAALSAFPNGRRIIYLPNGTYDISDTLSWPAGIPGWTDYKHTILQGQSRSGAILRLPNNAALFQNPAARRALIFTGPAPAQRFGIMICNLTVHTGTGNPGASGIQLNANNFGGMRMVRIVSGDGQGVSGLDLHFTAEIGPLLVEDLEVEGFDHGIRTGDAINGIVLERVTVRGQNVAGINNSGQVFSIRGLKSVNAVPAVIAGTNPFGGLDTGGACTLLDAVLIGLPGAENLNAITTSAFFYGHNIISTGYARVLTRPTLAGNANVNGSTLDEYQSRSILSLFPSPARSLQLPIEDPPAVPLDPTADWANVLDFGAVGNGSTDDTAAFQAAIDSGKPTVYVPPSGYFILQGDVILRGNVRRLTGTHANVGGAGRIVLGDGTAPAVVVERSGYPKILHQSARTLIISSVETAGIISTSPGKLFIEDVVTDKVDLQNPRLRAWARQLNTENGASTNVINAGATLWILGYKTERGQVKIETRAGGFTELLGAHIFSTTEAKSTPAFTVDDASVSIACMGETNFEGTQYSQWVSERRGATTSILADTSLPFRTSANGRAFTLFTGFDGAPKRPLDLVATAISPTRITLTWSDQSWDETSFQIERSSDGVAWDPLATLPAETTSYANDFTASPGATFFYRVRATNPTAPSAFTTTASATTPTLFQSWLQSYNLPSDTPPLSDADFDGLSNYLEFALNGNPVSSLNAPAPTSQVVGPNIEFTYFRARAELTYLVETSTNLTTWTTAGVAQSGSPAGQLATATLPYDPTTSPQRFLRLRVSEN